MNRQQQQDRIYKQWITMIKGLGQGTIDERLKWARYVSSATRDLPACQTLVKYGKYLDMADRVLRTHLTDQTQGENPKSHRMVALTIETLARILYYMPAMPKNLATDKPVATIEKIPFVTSVVDYLLQKPAYKDTHIACCKYLWAHSWKYETKSFKILSTFKATPQLVLFLESKDLELVRYAAGAIWGHCGKHGGNSQAQAIYGKLGAVKKLLRLLFISEDAKTTKHDVLMFVLLGALTALAWINDNNSLTILQLGVMKELFKFLKRADERYHNELQEGGKDSKKASIIAEYIAKGLEFLYSLCSFMKEQKTNFIALGGVDLLAKFLKFEPKIVHNQATILLLATVTICPIAQKAFGASDEVVTTLIGHMQRSNTEVKYNATLALAGLCWSSWRAGWAKDDDQKNRLEMQNKLFRFKALENAWNGSFLKPLENLPKNFRALPIKVGLRLLIDMSAFNTNIQLYCVQKLLHRTLCNDVLNKSFEDDVYLLALECLQAICVGNAKAQLKIVEDNVGHFIMGKVMRVTNNADVKLACASTLYRLCENNPTVEKQFFPQMSSTYNIVNELVQLAQKSK